MGHLTFLALTQRFTFSNKVSWSEAIHTVVVKLQDRHSLVMRIECKDTMGAYPFCI